MHKNKQGKRPGTKQGVDSPEQQEEAMTRSLVTLAAELARQQLHATTSQVLKNKESDFQKIIRKCLHQKKDEVLYEALERALEAEDGSYVFLKENIEEASGTIVFTPDGDRPMEVNAFVIPLFAHTQGGLHSEQCFQDEEAFDLLKQSISESQLESRKAKVVLVSHAYHLDEIDRINYSRLNDMVREAADSLLGKKTAATEISRSISGWPENHFAPDDQAVELRFLLGFALKPLDDPFYRVPEDEAAADRYFDTRAARFRHWTKEALPLVKRCLVTDGREIDIDFLYQDLFHGGKESGIAELDMLQMMSDLHHGLQVHNTSPENTKAVIGPAEAGEEMVLRVNLHALSDGALVASTDKPLAPARELEEEADDVCDALRTIGVTSFSLARRFDADGHSVDVRSYKR
ncbi:hypothetical protein GCM10027343_38970 [Noviherbaspirillum agri]